MVLSASMTRDSSPPDATRASGRASCPTFSATRNSTSSAPAGPISARRCQRGREPTVGNAEVGQAPDRPRGQGGRLPPTRKADRAPRRFGDARRGCALALGELPDVERRGIDEIELRARALRRLEHVGDGRAVLLR